MRSISEVKLGDLQSGSEFIYCQHTYVVIGADKDWVYVRKLYSDKYEQNPCNLIVRAVAD